MTVELSVLVPCFNVQAVIVGLVQALGTALPTFDAAVEVIIVDDGSTDLTLARARGLLTGRPWLRLLRVETREGKGNAISVGLRAARAPWVALVEPDPRYAVDDVVTMWHRARRGEADWFQGRRTPPPTPRADERFTRTIERVLLSDPTTDPGCPIRMFRTSVAAKLPLQYRGLLRFLPVYAARLGYVIAEHPIGWTLGPAPAVEMSPVERTFGALVDVLAVRWMFARVGDPASVELRLPRPTPTPTAREELAGPPPRATATLPPRDPVS